MDVQPVKRMRLAILGCGTVTESLHLPVATASDAFEVVCLVDRDVDRAHRLAKGFDVPNVSDDIATLADSVDAVIVALPNHLHASAAIDLLSFGLHVLVEKPMALDLAGCTAMAAAADASGRTLAVGLVRRFYASSLLVRDLLASGLLGDIVRVDVREGGIFRWKVASDFMFRREAGGGVLADIGAHAIDLLVWWLGDAEVVSYRDDDHGGVEADCEVLLTFDGGARGRVELSRLRTMRNTYVIEGTQGTLELGNGPDAEVTLRLAGTDRALRGQATDAGKPDQSLHEAFRRQLADFAQAIETGRAPRVSAAEGARAIAVIDSCMRIRQPLAHPWDEVPAHRKAAS